MAATVLALRSVGEINEVIVVDDGSGDQTAEIARRAGARVFRFKENRGKGEAVWTGARLARYSLLALADADLGSTASMVKKLILPVTAGRAEMAVAVFPARRPGSGFGLVKKLAAKGIEIISGKRFQEPLSGQRVFPGILLREMSAPPRGFGLEVSLILHALKRGYRITEVEVNMRHRELGRGALAFYRRGIQLSSVGRELWRELWAKW